MLRKILFHVAFCSLLVAAAPAVLHAACPAGFVTLDLKTGVPFVSGPLLPYVSYLPGGAPTPVPVIAGCPAAAGWKMAAIKIVIPPGTSSDTNACTQANIVVEYEGAPRGWSMNLGDSPTNDGHAGDGGTTEHEAEIWVVNEDLALAPANQLVPLGIDNPLAFQNLALTDGALKFVVKDQEVSWGQPKSRMQMHATNNLFALPDLTVPEADQRAIYLGLNRVISDPGDRTGCGARRVLISFQ